MSVEIRRNPHTTNRSRSSAASEGYKRQGKINSDSTKDPKSIKITTSGIKATSFPKKPSKKIRGIKATQVVTMLAIIGLKTSTVPSTEASIKGLSLIHIPESTRQAEISYAFFCW